MEVLFQRKLNGFLLLIYEPMIEWLDFRIYLKKNKRIKYQCQKIGAMTEGLNTFIFVRD